MRIRAKDNGCSCDPFGEGEIGRHDGGAALVAIGEQIEEQLAAGAVEGHEAQLVDNQDVDAPEPLLEAWGSAGVGLTATEFNRAHELGERYWLYVVEWATSNKPKIHRIQDPAGKANCFFFDEGWAEVSKS